MKNNGMTLIGGSLKGLKLSANVDDSSPKGTLAVRDGFVRTKSDEGWLSSADIRDRLFDFSSVTFKSTAVGPDGMSLASWRSLLPAADYPWRSDIALFNVVAGIVQFTVPMDGLYEISAAGATRANVVSGGISHVREVTGVFELKAGDKLHILVGQRGTIKEWVGIRAYGGGAGGTFVSLNGRSDLLLVSGGASSCRDGSTTVGQLGAAPTASAPGTLGGLYLTSNGASSSWAQPSATYLGKGPPAADGSSGGAVYQGYAGGGGGAGSTLADILCGRSYADGGRGGISRAGLTAYEYAAGGFGGGGGHFINTSGKSGYLVPGAGGYTGGHASGASYAVYFISGTGGNFIKMSEAKSSSSRMVSRSVAENGYCTIKLVA